MQTRKNRKNDEDSYEKVRRQHSWSGGAELDSSSRVPGILAGKYAVIQELNETSLIDVFTRQATWLNDGKRLKRKGSRGRVK